MTITDEPHRTDKQRLLGACFVFRALDDPARRELASHAYARSCRAGETIFRMGDAGQAMMAVARGTVRISVPTPGARQFVIADLAAGEVFGEIAVLDGGARSADATALTNCELVVLERRDVLALLERHPQAALKLLALLSARLRATDERMTEIAFLDVPTRLARTLLRATAGSPGNASVQRLSLSQSELAAMVGSTRENVNRCLGAWQRGGLVELRSGWLVIIDRAALAAIADGG